jgi:hypothetical protein
MPPGIFFRGGLVEDNLSLKNLLARLDQAVFEIIDKLEKYNKPPLFGTLS